MADMFPDRLSDMWREDTENGSVDILSDTSVALGKFTLEKVGSLIWRLCDGTRTADEIARQVGAACEEPLPSRETIVEDTVRFLQTLRNAGLLAWNGDRSVDVLLVVPPRPSLYSEDAVKIPEYSAPPLGICYVASGLRERGFSVTVLDMHQQAWELEDVVKECRCKHPFIVGITATTPSYPNAERVARFIKAWDESVVTIVGGPHATAMPQQCASSKAIDYVCIGEGERTMADLADALMRNTCDPSDVPGLAFWADGQFRCTPFRDQLANLDNLPLPARDLLDLDQYCQKGSIVSSRGCPIGCDFCSCSAIVGNTYRTHSVERVLYEIEHVIEKHNCRFFDFHDDTFNLDPDRVIRFCAELRKRGIDIEWGCFCRAAQMTPEMAKTMAESGCSVIQYGVEAGTERVLHAINKRTTLRQVEDAVRSAVAAGVDQVVCGFIIGHAEDTEQR